MTRAANVTVYLNAATRPLGEHEAAIRLNGWVIANAPRPLPGVVSWTGEFRHGIYYSAGPAADFDQAWRDLDGWRVEVLSNLDIMPRLDAAAREHGFASLAACLEENELTVAEMARAMDLPWYEAKS